MSDDTALVVVKPGPLVLAGAAADAAAQRGLFADYRARRAERTTMSQDDDLTRFAVYLSEARAIAPEQVPVYGAALASDPDAWRVITWGLVRGFVAWQAQHGYAIATINRALSTVKAYAKLASQAGALAADAYQLIRSVSGYAHREGTRLDAQRPQSRKGEKKAEHTRVTREQAVELKAQPADTPIGRRDALLMCLLLDHGLRVGELAGLRVEHLDLQAGTLVFYRPKVDRTQTHRLTADTLRVVMAYLQANEPAYIARDVPRAGPLLLAATKAGELLPGKGMSDRGINKRVAELGRRVGIEGLSPHDCRHYWATRAMASGTDVAALQDAGGWASPAMPLRYAEASKVANERVKLD